ncbi:DNA polymerase III subunit chi [Roseateles cellulosilyticus]|uniref:DNA polymerase III subunit chi n=1 Tax=Pelomonas cellulosilytica TaxID=2906762 RepID=A0ABS8Y380_9BURK|nr:DNA polymerase III subunit chi [Pelomonas sp. P8]
MTVQVSFYSDAADPLHFACRLVRRALASGKPVGVCVSAGDAERLDALLWSFDAAEFIPHRCWDGADAAVAGEVLLVEDASLLPHRGLLLNLAQDLPGDALAFERVLEVVGREPAIVQAGRARYRSYQQAGARLDHFSAAG